MIIPRPARPRACDEKLGGFGEWARSRFQTRVGPSCARATLVSLSVEAVGLHKVRLDVGVGGPLRTLNKKLTRWGFRSFRVHLPSLSYDLGHGDVASHETAPIAMELSPHRGAEHAAGLARANASDAARAAAARAERIARRPAQRGAALELAAAPFVFDAFAPQIVNVEMQLTCRRDAPT